MVAGSSLLALWRGAWKQVFAAFMLRRRMFWSISALLSLSAVIAFRLVRATPELVAYNGLSGSRSEFWNYRSKALHANYDGWPIRGE